MMEKIQWIAVMGIYPGMYASKFLVRQDSWDYFIDVHLNDENTRNCFIPAMDAEGEPLFIDMTKLLAFYVLKQEFSKKAPKSKKKDSKKA